MSKAEILAELPKLKPEERHEVLERICQLDRIAGDQWLDSGELSEAEKQLLESRLSAYEKAPDAGDSWENVEARIRARLKS